MPVPRSVIVSRGMRGICQNGNFSKRDFPGHTDCVSDTPCPGGSLFFSTGWAGIRRLRTAGTCRAPRRGKRVDTKVSTLLTPTSFLFRSPAQTRDRRPLRKGERQSGYRCMSFSAFSQFTDSVLLHRRLSLRRRDITVSRNFWARYTGRHLRICLFGTIYLRRCCLL